MTGDEHVEISRHLGVFLRRAERFWGGMPVGPTGARLERAAYLLLSRLATEGPQRLSVLAGDACLDLSTVSRQVAALEAAGLVGRTGDPRDRRASVITMTQAGEDVLARARASCQAALRDVLADWEPRERAEFARLFARFTDGLAGQQDARQQKSRHQDRQQQDRQHQDPQHQEPQHQESQQQERTR